MSRVPSPPALTCAAAKAWEQRVLPDEASEWTAMQEAGANVALAALDDFKELGGLPARARLLVLAGKGHNGGDALLAACAILRDWPDARAVVVLCFGVGALRPLARRSLDALMAVAPERAEVLPAERALGAEQSYALCLDGVFGFQFRPPLDEVTAQLLASVNAHPAIRLRAAVDLPSGVGETNAPTVFRADFTYATGIVKSPVLAPSNAAAVGRLRYVELGLLADDSAPEETERVLTARLLAPLAALRAAQSDKRTFGHLLVVGGSRSYPGAVLLAVRAALRAGTGLVTAFVPESLAATYAVAHPEVMWVGCPETKTGGLALGGSTSLTAGTAGLLQARAARATALLIGPGLAADPETLALAAQIVREAAVPLVLDADALRPEIVGEARAKPFVTTPHAGELARIAPALFVGKKFTAPHGVLVAKGPLTRVTDGRVNYYSPFGGPVLARGGSGDMLAGLIGGLLAQQPDDPLLAACRGVVWHGRAADALARTRGQVAVESSELLGQLGPVLQAGPGSAG